VTALNIVTYIFIGVGLFFNLVGVVGLHRFPDIYTKLHAATKCTTFGSIFLITAVIVQSAGIWALEGAYPSQSVICIRAVLVLVALLVTNATGAHAIARAAHRSGVKPARAVVDDLEAKQND